MSRLIALLIVLLGAGAVFAQGRDPWARLQRMDADEDGKVSRAEFSGPDRLWDRLDGDGDGFVTKTEAKAMRRGGRERGGGASEMTRRFDANGDGKVSEAEWSAFFEKADDNGDGILDQEEMAAALGGRRYNDSAPNVGDAAPKVKAKDAASGREIDLGAPVRPTVLVFGSWT